MCRLLPLPLALLSLLANAARAADAPAPGVPFRSEAGGFEVRFPAPPSERPSSVGAGLVGGVARVMTRDGAFSVGWYDHFPEAERVRGAVFRAELASIARGGARDLEDVDAPLAGLPGRSFRARVEEGNSVRGRVAMRGTRVFLLLVLGRPERIDAISAPFFDSFALAGAGVPHPPTMPAARRVAFPEAGVSLALHGEVDRSGGSDAAAPRSQIAARSRGALRIESAIFTPGLPRSSRERRALVDGIAASFVAVEPGAARVRALVFAREPAYELRASSPDRDVWMRVALVRRGVLVLRVDAVPGSLPQADAEAFFDSVRPEPGG